MAQMDEAYPAVAASPELASLLIILDAFPRFLRAAQRQDLLKGLRKRIEKRLAKQWKKLDEALHDPAHDRHRLRLLIKRVRMASKPIPSWIACRSRRCPAEIGAGGTGRLARLLAVAGAGPSRRRSATLCRDLANHHGQGRAPADRVLDKFSKACFKS
jgi:hypothetical protein